MKILYVGNIQGLNNIGKYYLTEQRLMNGFTRLGHSVYGFNDRDHARKNFLNTQSLGKKKMNRKLINDAIIYEPDLIILSHCKNVSNDTLEEIREKIPNVKIIYTNVDPLNDAGNIKSINQRLGIVDAIFITSNDLDQFSSDKTIVKYFPNPVDKAIDTNKSFENNCTTDLLLLGRALTHQQDIRRELAEFLSKKEALNIYIGGVGINDNLHYGADYMKVLANTKMGVSLSKERDRNLYASDRLSHYLASGIMTFVPEESGFEDLLEDGFVPFNSSEDLWDKALYYYNNNDKRIAIAKKGYDIAHTKFASEKICADMLATIY